MRSTNIILGGLALLAIGGAALAIPLIAQNQTQSAPPMTELTNKTSTAVQLRLYKVTADTKPNGSYSPVIEGRDIYAADGQTLIASYNQLYNGGREDVHFRADQTKQWSRDFYPQTDGVTIQRSVAWFEANGKTYHAHEVRQINGKWERYGQLLPDGNYEERYFCPDGKTLEKDQIFDNAKIFLSENAIFCDTGKSVRQLTAGEYNSKVLTIFNQDGKPKSTISEHTGNSVSYKGDVFDAGGQIVAHFDHYYDEHGSEGDYQSFSNGVLDREWNGADHYGLITVTFYDKSDDKQHKRFSQGVKPEDWPSKLSHLITVTEYADDGKTARRSINFDKYGTPTTVTVPTADPDKTIIYTLDDVGVNIVKAALHTISTESDQAAPLPAQTRVTVPDEETTLVERPADPQWDDGKTNTGDKLYDFP